VDHTDPEKHRDAYMLPVSRYRDFAADIKAQRLIRKIRHSLMRRARYRAFLAVGLLYNSLALSRDNRALDDFPDGGYIFAPVIGGGGEYAAFIKFASIEPVTASLIAAVITSLLLYMYSIPLLSSDGAPRGISGGPRYLEIESARIRVRVKHLARKKQTAYKLRLHGFGVYLPDVHPSAGHDGFFHGSFTLDIYSEFLERIYKDFSFLLTEFVCFKPARYSRARRDYRNEL
jgi:hypothetical protein